MHFCRGHVLSYVNNFLIEFDLYTLLLKKKNNLFSFIIIGIKPLDKS